MSVQNVYLYTDKNSEQAAAQQQPQKTFVTVPVTKIRPDLISREGANALRAYCLQNNISSINNSQNSIGTSVDYIEKLNTKGFKEGRDYMVNYDHNSCTITLLKFGKPVKDICWELNSNGEEELKHYSMTHHSTNNDVEKVTTYYEKDNKFMYRTHTYETNPIKNDELCAYTRPEQYLDYLEQKGIKYTIDYNWDSDEVYHQSISSYNPLTDSMLKVRFTRDLKDESVTGITKEIYDSDNNIDKSVQYYPDHTDITEFKNRYQ